MMEIREYLLRLTATAILAAVIRQVAPSGGAGRVTRMCAGILIILAAFSPLGKPDLLEAAQHLAQTGMSDPLSAEEFDQKTNLLLADLISQEAETYILDKAYAMNLDLEVEVKTSLREEGYPMPWQATLRGDPLDWQRLELSRSIEEDLGIPKERQTWWTP